MLTRKQYAKPPLLEVFCEFFFDLEEDPSWDGFLVPRFFEAIEADFPSRKHLQAFGVQLRLDEGGQVGVERKGSPTPRHRFESHDGKTLVQVGENLLVVNQLPPYYGWERFAPRVIDCWQKYSSVWQPKRISRLALHYIDKIDIPDRQVRLENYFNLYPTIPQVVDKPMANLAMAFEVTGDQDGDVLVASFRQLASADPTMSSFLFQWDYVSGGEIESTPEAVGSWLAAAHTLMSTYFRATMTEECEKLFQPAGEADEHSHPKNS
ncbi:MAG: TIGR04255 family protein [Pirellulales bacterium]